MTPTIGRIVHYCLTEQDAECINRRRVNYHLDPSNEGFIFHTGNVANAGDVFPAMAVRVNDDGASVNAQVLLDGNDTLWVTSVVESVGAVPGGWFWPPRV